LLSLATTEDTSAHQSLGIKNLLRSTILTSKRHGSWFRLSLQERAICSLAVKLKVSFKSQSLMNALVSILRKLRNAGEILRSRLANGMLLAWAFSEAAVGWGNSKAHAWRADESYIQYLGLAFGGGRG
jgi:hypothetical protein